VPFAGEVIAIVEEWIHEHVVSKGTRSAADDGVAKAAWYPMQHGISVGMVSNAARVRALGLA
jgi:hypothetical protein